MEGISVRVFAEIHHRFTENRAIILKFPLFYLFFPEAPFIPELIWPCRMSNSDDFTQCYTVVVLLLPVVWAPCADLYILPPGNTRGWRWKWKICRTRCVTFKTSRSPVRSRAWVDQPLFIASSQRGSQFCMRWGFYLYFCLRVMNLLTLPIIDIHYRGCEENGK